MLLGVLIFVVSIAAAGFSFFAKGYLAQSQEKYKIDLADNEKRFNLPLIEELRKANTKIDLAKQLLKNHVAVSEALGIISGLTAEKVRFTDFEFSAPDATASLSAAARAATAKSGSTYKIKMKGLADSFNSIAFQSDVFGRSQKYGTNKVIRNPVLSDLSVAVDGSVQFNFATELVLADVSYEKALAETLQAEGLTN